MHKMAQQTHKIATLQTGNSCRSPHIPMTPVDNLAWYWDIQYNQSPGRKTKFFRFILHDIADASVPMHVVGAFGWGHRAYEDIVTVMLPSLLVGQRDSEPTRLNTILLPRAEAYYKIIAEWPSVNLSRASEVLVQALVTAVAQQSWVIAKRIQPCSTTPCL